MDHKQHGPVTGATILRRRQVEAATGDKRSTLYLRISQGLLPAPVRLGPRTVGWPAREIVAVNEARIAGATDDEVRALAQRLRAARGNIATEA